jgi:hypothetical protein
MIWISGFFMNDAGFINAHEYEKLIRVQDLCGIGGSIKTYVIDSAMYITDHALRITAHASPIP